MRKLCQWRDGSPAIIQIQQVAETHTRQAAQANRSQSADEPIRRLRSVRAADCPLERSVEHAAYRSNSVYSTRFCIYRN